MPETIREKQNYVLAERQESDKRYVLFGGRILNMDEQMEQRLTKNLRAHRVRGGIINIAIFDFLRSLDGIKHIGSPL